MIMNPDVSSTNLRRLDYLKSSRVIVSSDMTVREAATRIVAVRWSSVHFTSLWAATRIVAVRWSSVHFTSINMYHVQFASEPSEPKRRKFNRF